MRQRVDGGALGLVEPAFGTCKQGNWTGKCGKLLRSVFAAILIGAFWPVVDSYLEWRRERAEGAAGGGAPLS